MLTTVKWDESPPVSSQRRVVNLFFCTPSDDLRLAYPFFFQPSPGAEDGSWSEFSTEHEFSKLILRSDDWRISQVNANFKVRSVG